MIVIDHVVDRTNVVMGMNAINSFGNVSVGGDVVSFGASGASYAVSMKHERKMSSTTILLTLLRTKFFRQCSMDGGMTQERGAPMLKNKLRCYQHTLKEYANREFKGVIERWIKAMMLSTKGKNPVQSLPGLDKCR